ncbi:MAG: hypothetical protein WC758_00180 [Candidatus Woesearchaeota archaeon]
MVKLKNIFKKKKEEDYDSDDENSDEIIETKPKKGSKKQNNEIILDQFQIKLEALNEFRKITNERFMHLSEELGQLRGGISNAEREIGEVTVKSARTTDLVSSVQPEKFYELIKKQEAKLASFEQKLDANRELMTQLVESVKAVRTKIEFYKGVEQVVQLNHETSEMLSQTRKMIMLSQEHADKTEKYFLKTEKQFKSFEKFEKDRQNMQELHMDITKEINNMKVKLADFSTRDELYESKTEIENASKLSLDVVNRMKMDLAKMQESLKLFEKKVVITSNSEEHLRKKMDKLIESTRH